MFAVEDQIVPALPARSVAEEVRAAVVEDILGDLLPRDLRGGELLASGELVHGFLQELDLSLVERTDNY